MTKVHTCKFCGHIFAKDHPCEYSSYWDERHNEQVTTYCGNQQCPMCTMCQGNEATPSMTLAARAIAEINRNRGAPCMRGSVTAVQENSP